MRILALTLLITSGLGAQAPLAYPPTRKAEVVDDYFGTKVPDPYRWLEDDNAAETKAWVKAQNEVTTRFLEGIPERAAIHARLTQLWNFERFSVPFRKGSRFFYTHNSGLQNQAVLWVTERLEDRGRVLLDPNTLSKDGTVALSEMAVSEDGRNLAYSISVAGSDWQTWKVRDVATGQDLPDEVRWSKFSGAAWTKDGEGFYYSRYDAPKDGSALTAVNKFQKLYFHRVGTSQEQDRLVHERPDQPDWGFSGKVTEDGRWLVISQWEGTDPRNRVFVQDLARPGSPVEPLLDRFDATYTLVEGEGDRFLLVTNQAAPRFRLVAVQKGKPDPSQWTELIPQGPDRDVLESVSRVGGRLVATWMRDARTAVTLHGLDGKRLQEVALPTLGSASGFAGKASDVETYFSFTSFTTPPGVHRLDLKTGRTRALWTPKLGFDPSAYEVRQVFYPSKDGTRIPMFLVHRKGLKRDGQNPTFLYGYGGFNAPLTPWYSSSSPAWLELGGVYAVANLRGGGEYGQAWHDAGRRAKKQNVFDDFIAAAEYLIREKVTSTPKLAINGASNGGLLVGACLTQRPDLFGAAVPEVGVMDMLRYHTFTIGWAWKSDFDTSETREGFQRLMTYSPLHTIRPGTAYPPTLILTSDHDDRVVPAHSHKFTATLQAAQGGPAPILTRIETDAGHGAGTPTAKVIQERTDVWSFLVKVLGVRVPPSFGK